MSEFLMGNSLNKQSAAAGAVLVYILCSWPRLAILQRMVGLQFFFVILHITEECMM